MSEYKTVKGITVGEMEWASISSTLEAYNAVAKEPVDINACIYAVRSYDYWINIDLNIDASDLFKVIPDLKHSYANSIFMDSEGRFNVSRAIQQMLVWERFGHASWVRLERTGLTRARVERCSKDIHEYSRPGIMVTSNEQ